MTTYKAYEIANFKALTDGPGTFEAIVSVFGNVDLQGDRTMPGAFAKTIANWRAKAAPIPVVWSHEWLNPEAHVGYAMPDDVMEVTLEQGPNGETGGLYVKGRMDVNKPFAGQVFDLLKEGRIREWSFAYDTISERPGEDGANELYEVDLIEVGPTLKGANSSTFTVTAKAKAAVESELKQAYDAQRSLTKFLDLAEQIDDPTIARVLARTYKDNEIDVLVDKTLELPPVETARFHVEVDEDAKFICVSNKTGKTVDAHDESADADTHAAKLRHTSLENLSDEARAALDLEPITKSEPVKVVVEAAGKTFEVDPAALELKDEDAETKVSGKPWHIEEQDGQYCCIVDASGETLDCHDTLEDAEAHIVALYANASSDDADGEKATQPLTEDDMRTHLVNDHGIVADSVGATALNHMEETHMNLHGQGHVDHEHENVGNAEGKDDAPADGKSIQYITTSTNTSTDLPVTVNITNDTITLSDIISTELKTALGTGEKVGRTIGRNSATALKEALIRAVDDFVKSVNERAVDESATEDSAEKGELNGYNEKLAALLGEEN